MTELILAWVGGICLTGTGVFLLGLFCGECVRRNRVLRDVTTEIDVRPRDMRQPLAWDRPAAKGFASDFAREIDSVVLFAPRVTSSDKRRMN